MWLFGAFIAVPLIEIGLFIQIGGFLGLFPTLAIVVLTAILGSWLVRSQGARELANLRGSFNELRDPSEPLANGAMILFAGALLLTPGFFTDALGFALLFPPFRAFAYQQAKSRMNIQSFSSGHSDARSTQNADGDTVIDGEFKEVDPNQKPSGWTKH